MQTVSVRRGLLLGALLSSLASGCSGASDEGSPGPNGSAGSGQAGAAGASTLPSAGAGALLVLLLLHIELSVVALIGIILLIGIVKKNGIMMVDFAIQAEREQGLSPHDAIRQACLLRFRPIMMTTMAALLGALPLALGRGTGSELRQPLGYTMVGGLIVSQAMTLFTTPVVYLYLDQFSLWLKRRRANPRSPHPRDEPQAETV